jgi:hypothetical protein
MTNPTKQIIDEQGNMVESVMTDEEYTNWKTAVDEAALLIQ